MKNTTKTTSNLFTVDFVNQKIFGSKKAIAEASKGNGAAYEELSRLIKRHAAFTIEVKVQQKHIDRAKVSYNGLDYDFMEEYIKTKRESDILMNQYEEVKKFAKYNKKSVYPFTKSWFIEKFGEKNEEGKTDILGKVTKQFNMEKAAAEIKAFNLEAVNSATVVSINAEVAD